MGPLRGPIKTLKGPHQCFKGAPYIGGQIRVLEGPYMGPIRVLRKRSGKAK
jgi:hypothetical protein